MSRNSNTIGLGLLRQPTTVLFGPRQREQLPFVARSLGRHALICTDERMAASAEFEEIVSGLRANGLEVSVFSQVEPDLPRDNLVQVVEELAERAVDVLIGLGGGSCMDFAKISAILLARGGDVRDLYGENLVPGPGLPVITVPTTGGTGAEVTCISVIHDADKGMKVGVASPYLQAHTAVIDPELTVSCPPALSAATGADALSHLIEAFTARAKNPAPEQVQANLYVGKNRLTDLYARSGLALLNTSLERVTADPTDLSARADTMLGAYNAGMAINTTGTAGAHALQSPIGALTQTPHGFGVGALLPYVMRYNLPERVDEFAEMGRIFGISSPERDLVDQARAAINRVEEVLRELRVPLTLKELGLEPDQISYVAKQAVQATRLTANNPRELTESSIEAILQKGYDGDLSWWQL